MAVEHAAGTGDRNDRWDRFLKRLFKALLHHCPGESEDSKGEKKFCQSYTGRSKKTGRRVWLSVCVANQGQDLDEDVIQQKCSDREEP